MKRLILLLFCCIALISSAQQQTYDLPESRFKLGFNLGGAWQNSDVRAKGGSGVGLTLEYALLQNATAPIGISVRGRYLYSQTYGQDLKESIGFLKNDAINGVNDPSLNYLPQGVVYHNFKTESNNFDLELMLTANRLRRNHLIAYVFGGIGTMGYNSFLDKKGIDGSQYDYIGMRNSDFHSTKTELQLMQDGIYETRAESIRRPHWVFAPSLGAAFGIRFSPVFSMIFEHKVTFPATDLLDGQRWTGNNNPTAHNDIHHYANLGLRFGIGGGRVKTRTDGNIGGTTPTPPPVITVLEPSSYPATAPNCNAELIFRVSNITSKENVEIRLNGRLLASAEYKMDWGSNQFTLNKKINGESVFQIRAFNTSGEDNETVQIGCSPTLYPPIITLVDPSTPNVNSCQASFKLSVTNIQSKNQIEIRQNGNVVSTSQYDYDPASGLITMYSITLTSKATFAVKATNATGSASFQISFTCSATPVGPTPEVIIVSPSGSPYVSVTCSEEITARLVNIKATDRIQVLINNTPLRSSQYTFNPATGILKFKALIADNAFIVINASNAQGSASGQLQIQCRPAPVVLPPTVQINLPVVTPYISSSCNEQVVAYATNVPDKTGIQILVNNRPLAPALFSYNAMSGEISLQVEIQNDAVIKFIVTNPAGRASDECIIRCKPSVPSTPKPTVTITTPPTDTYVSTTCTENIIAQTRHVSRKQDINVYVNGVQLNTSEFNFDPTAQRIQLNQTISQRSVVQFIVSNEGGSSVDQVEIVCQPPVVTKPAVSITQPTYNVSVNPNCTEHIVATTSNVSSKNQITINLNGKILNPQDYIFDPASQKIEFNSLIVNPTNIRVTVSNGTASATDQKTMTCSPAPVVLPPTITITNPGSETYTSVTCRERITAQVTNVSSKSEIEIWVGTKKLGANEFSLSTDNRSVSFESSLNNGNTIRIRVSNSAGTAEDQVTVTCIYPPVVTITTPTSETFTSTDCREVIMAGITNITSKSQTNVYVNGQRLDVAMYEYNSANHTLSLNHIFSGTSTVKIEATNEAGISSDVVVMNCKPVEPPKPLPIITLLNPVSGSASQQVCNDACAFEVNAKLENVTDPTMCIVSVDNQVIAGNQYTFNTSTGLLSITRKPATGKTEVIQIMARNANGSAKQDITLSCTKSAAPARIVITTPATPEVSSQTCEQNVVAKATNISSGNIHVFVNGSPVSAGQYKWIPETKEVKLTIQVKGTSVVKIEGENDCGKASDEVSFRCLPPPPAVTITTPAASPYTSVECQEAVQVTVTNVTGKEQIVLKINGQQMSDDVYSYNPSTDVLDLITKVETNTSVEIIATNESGTASDKVVMNCKPRLGIPTVTITTPSATPYTSISCQETVKATVTNVTGKDQITVKANGITIGNDQYVYNATTHVVEIATKVEATTTIEITVTNESGTATDNVVINCKPKTAPPTVTIINPSTTPHTSTECSETITAVELNITSVDQIVVKINGQAIGLDQFTYNPETHRIILTTGIVATTTVEFIVTNEAGTASDKIVITCKPKPGVPVVTITNPASTPYTSADCQETVKATVLNVTGKNQIEVKANGQTLADEQYTFNSATHILEITTRVEANTTIEIIATNESGTASDKVVMNCKPNVKVPTVTITNPSSTPYASATCQETVKATVMNVTGKAQIMVKANGQTIPDEQYTYNASTHVVELTVRVAANTTIEIIANNEAGTASDKVVMNCQPVIDIPTFPETNTCPTTSPAKYVDCETCHLTESGQTSLSVEAGKKVCIKNTFRGAITMNGGMLVICGTAEPSSLNFVSGTIVVNGEATFGSLNLNNSSCTFRNFGTMTIGGTTFNSRIENYGSMTITSDCNVNTNGVLKNTGELNVRGSVNNGNDICNSGTMNITGSLHNNNGATFVNSCKVIVTKEFHNNSDFENTGSVRSTGKTVINGGSLFKMGGGSRLVAGSLDFNGTISGTSNQCAVVNVSGQTVVNGGARLTGNATLCDANGIEQNNSGGAITSNCNCSVPVTTCVPNDGVVVTEEEKKVRICHKPPGNPENCHTIEVGENAVRAHLAHGDAIGECTDCGAKKVEFVINNGKVIPSQCFKASVTVLGCALKEGGVGIDYPVLTQVSFGNTAIDPFGTYSGYNKSSDVNDHKAHTWNSTTAFAANTAIVVKAKSINPKTSALLYERTSSNNDAFVKVLRNGDAAPKVAGFAGQEDAESYMKEYILDGKMTLGRNQAIFLFELGTNNTTSKSHDLQDCVVLVTLMDEDCPTSNEDAERKQREEQERLDAEKKQREEQQRLEAEKKQREEQQRQEAERKQREEQERLDAEKKQREEQQRLEAEKKQREEQQRQEAERKQREEQERLDAEKKQREEQQRLEAEKKQREEQQRQEAERKQREEQERLDAEKKQREEQQRLEAEKKQREEQQRQEAERKQREEQERLDAEKKQREEQERLEREQKEKESQEGEKKEGN